MAYYKKCPYCGANLDPGESCRCQENGMENDYVGYEGIGPEKGTFVRSEDAYAYALERCTKGAQEDRKEFREMLVEWFYSGNWIRAE